LRATLDVRLAREDEIRRQGFGVVLSLLARTSSLFTIVSLALFALSPVWPRAAAAFTPK
jgi:hypothetical protein